jgi:phosphotransferase system HPr (HPr) family protein
MSGSTLRQSVRISNPQGFHMRPKQRFAELAMQFASEVRVIWDGQGYNGKSMWDLMLVGAEQNHEVIVEAEGPDAAEAVPALVAVLAAPGGEDGGAAPEAGG